MKKASDEPFRIIPEPLRTLLSFAGGAYSSTEESIRQFFSERFPEFVQDQIRHLAGDAWTVVQEEIRRYFERFHLADEVARFLSTYDLHFRTEIHLRKRDDGQTVVYHLELGQPPAAETGQRNSKKASSRSPKKS